MLLYCDFIDGTVGAKVIKEVKDRVRVTYHSAEHGEITRWLNRDDIKSFYRFNTSPIAHKDVAPASTPFP